MTDDEAKKLFDFYNLGGRQAVNQGQSNAIWAKLPQTKELDEYLEDNCDENGDWVK